MGYIIAIILLVIVVPFIFLLLSKRTRGAGTLGGVPHSGGVTPSEPSSDQPTPQMDSVNQPAAEAEHRIPPG